MKVLLVVLVLLCCGFLLNKPAYQLFKQSGKPAGYEQLLQDATEADIVLFGELHNNPICHWLELQLLKDIYNRKKDKIVLGAEMFEADNQLILDEYAQGRISARQFEAEARTWDNYVTDYKPLVEFSMAHQVPFVATNIPRRYAGMVAKSDLAALDSLSAEAKQWIAPLPIQVDLSLPGYKKMTEPMEGNMVHGHGMNMNISNMAKAQAVKDATMAHFISSNWQSGKTFLHINGSYHSENFEGIVWYLQKQNPSLKILTIASVEQENMNKLNEKSKDIATYILAIPSDMTKTY